ncbi:MAG: murein biosynthesis integral membrane protein MurJ [Clostridia bacterium]|nr:murein biosynthesis integral membrane protein MurJ [Clostridia bacterium]
MSRRSHTARTTLTVTLIIILSKTMGFVREMVLAAYFGQSVESDAYVAAYSILAIMMLLFSAGISSTFIPIYTRARLRAGDREADKYASGVLMLYLVLGVLASIAAYALAPAVCSLVYRAKEGLDLTIELTRIMYPALAFFAMSGVLTNVLNAREKFIPEQLMGFVMSFLLIGACVFFGSIRAVAISVALTGVLQFLLIVPFMRRQFRFTFRAGGTGKDLLRTFTLAIPALISMAFNEINHQVDVIIGSSLTVGVITAVNKSYSLVAAVQGILVVPLTTIMFSRLSRIAAREDRKAFAETVSSSLEILAMIILPVSVICLFLQQEIIALAFQRGAFTAANTAFTAPVFGFYILGTLGFGFRSFLTRVFYARQDTRSPMWVGILCVGVNIGLDILLARPMGACGLTLATSVSGFVGAIVLLILLKKKLEGTHFIGFSGQLLRMAAATAIAFGAMYFASMLLPFGAGLGRLFLRCVLCAAVYLASFLVLCAVLKVRVLRDLKSMIKR